MGKGADSFFNQIQQDYAEEATKIVEPKEV